MKKILQVLALLALLAFIAYNPITSAAGLELLWDGLSKLGSSAGSGIDSMGD